MSEQQQGAEAPRERSAAEVAKLLAGTRIRAFRRDKAGAVVTDEKGRPIAEERAIGARDILGWAETAAGLSVVIADGRRLLVGGGR